MQMQQKRLQNLLKRKDFIPRGVQKHFVFVPFCNQFLKRSLKFRHILKTFSEKFADERRFAEIGELN